MLGMVFPPSAEGISKSAPGVDIKIFVTSGGIHSNDGLFLYKYQNPCYNYFSHSARNPRPFKGAGMNGCP